MQVVQTDSTTEKTNLYLNDKQLTFDEKEKLKPLIDEAMLEEFGRTFEQASSHFSFPMEKTVNFVAFLHRLTPEQRDKLNTFEKLNIENDIKEDIRVFMRAFQEYVSVNTVSETFQKGVSALAAAGIISHRQIDYIMGN
jgi:hypothetical protein